MEEKTLEKVTLRDEDAEKVSGGNGAWVRMFCRKCGKNRTMNVDAYGNYTCIICRTKYTTAEK